MRTLFAMLALLIAAPAYAQPERDIVARAKADLIARGVDLSGECGAFQITRLAAWRLRETGAGLLSKTSGAQCQGFAVDVVAYADGRTFDVLIDGGQANGPDWRQHLPHDPAIAPRWRPPIDPGDTPGTGGGQVVVQPQPIAAVDFSRVYRELETIRAEQQSLFDQAERVYSDLTRKHEALVASLALHDQRLEAHDKDPSWVKKLFTNANTYAVIAGMVSGWLVKDQMAK
jgi:hypothetical protein